MSESTTQAGVDLYWLPLGAGEHFVRWNGRVYELLAARPGRRAVCDLYHSALEARAPEGRFVIESASTRRSDAGEMWNSNSPTAWLLACSGIKAEAIRPPRRGGAGWNAGLAVARGAAVATPRSEPAVLA